MDDSSVASPTMDETSVVELTGKIMMVAIIVLFVVVVFVILLHLYAKWYWYRLEQDGSTTVRIRRRGQRELAAVTALRHGLDPSVLKSIPVVEFNTKDFKDGLECAVCLSEVSEGEKARLLPKCNHGFHVECIDMWFQSHSTCPLCRNPVSNQSSSNCTSSEASLETILQTPVGENSSINGFSEESPNFPTNVLFWGNETQVSSMGSCLEDVHQGGPSSSQPASTSSASSSSSSPAASNRPEGMLVIDIPRHINVEEDTKSPAPSRMRSLKRLLSMVNPSSPRNVDVEQQADRGQN